jgi:NADH:ubiquinone oxidoreductase subunit C
VTWVERVAAAYGSEPDAETIPLTVDVSAAMWLPSLTVARDELGCDFFDFLSAVDNETDGFVVMAHLVARRLGSVDTVLLRTPVPADAPELTCVCSVYAGAGWHERETHEMFGIGFDGHEPLDPLLLPDGFEGHPLRKDFVLASRVAKQWPGAKEPGESGGESSPSRRRTRPPGVPARDDWGPAPRGGDSPDRG